MRHTAIMPSVLTTLVTNDINIVNRVKSDTDSVVGPDSSLFEDPSTAEYNVCALRVFITHSHKFTTIENGMTS